MPPVVRNEERYRCACANAPGAYGTAFRPSSRGLSLRAERGVRAFARNGSACGSRTCQGAHCLGEDGGGAPAPRRHVRHLAQKREVRSSVLPAIQRPVFLNCWFIFLALCQFMMPYIIAAEPPITAPVIRPFTIPLFIVQSLLL